MLRAAVGLLLLAMVGRDAGAQEVTRSWDRLLQPHVLRTGDAVIVNGVRGAISAVAVDSLVLNTQAGMRSWSATDVQEIRRRDSIENGVWIGLGIAAVPFSVIHWTVDGGGYWTVSWRGPALLGVGAFFGGFLDARIQETVYRRLGATRMRLTTRMPNGSLGAGMSVEW